MMSTPGFYKHSESSVSQNALRDNDELEMEIRDDDAGKRQTGPAVAVNGNGVINEKVVTGESDVEHFCGWFGCRPRWLQELNRPQWLLVSMCCVTVIQGMVVNGFTPGSLSSIERRFELSSQSTGVLASTYDIVNVVFVLFVSFIGARRHKIRWMAVGCVLIGVAAFMYTIPHFTTSPYSYVASGSTTVCASTRNASGDDAQPSCGDSGDDDDDGEAGLSNYIYLFCGAQAVAGLGSLPIYTLGLAALDESVSNKNYGPYFGILYAVAIFGPGLGFILSGSFLNIYTELDIPPRSDFSPEDPGWVGAWWLGFIMCGVIALLIAIPLSLFPRELPTTAEIRANKVVEAHANAGLKETTRAGFGNSPMDLLRALKYLLINPTFVFTCMGGVADGFLISGFNVFLPKFMESQFSLTTGFSTILAGGAAILGGIIGSLLVGVILKKVDFTLPGKLRFLAACTFVSGLLFLGCLLQCQQEPLAGVSISYTGSPLETDTINVTWSCNAECSCAEDQYIPVCAEDAGVQYFTPCHAGCTEDGNGTYSNCSCLESVETGDFGGSVIIAGKCRENCGYQAYVFALIAALIVALFYVVLIAGLKVVMRCVPDSQRAMGLGVHSLVTRGLGSIPSPIVFGLLIDQSCLLWQDNCGSRGSCWTYEKSSLAWKLTAMALGLKAVGIAMFLIASVCYTPAKTDDDGNDDAIEAEKTGRVNAAMELGGE